MPKQRKKIPPGQRLAKKLRRRKQPLKRKAKVNYRYWRMRAKALLREKRVEWTEFLDRRFEKSLLKLGKHPGGIKMFCDRRTAELNRLIDAKKSELLEVFKKAAKIPPSEIFKPRKAWTAKDRANNERYQKLIRKELAIENQLKELKVERQWLAELRKSAT